MTQDEINLKEIILPHDLALIEDAWPEIWAMVERHPFSEQIQFLLANQDLSRKKVLNIRREMSEPNCIGTALFVAGLSPLGYPYHGLSVELGQHMKEDDGLSLAQMIWHCTVERRRPGVFIFSHCGESDDWHAGIYVGQIGNEHIAFAQHGRGRPFGFESIRQNYADAQYYTPSTLAKE